MDFITGFPKVLGKDCIFVVVDRLTKFSHLFSITTTFTAPQLIYSLNKFPYSMGFPRAFLMIEVAYFLVHFGKNSPKWWGQI